MEDEVDNAPEAVPQQLHTIWGHIPITPLPTHSPASFLEMSTVYNLTNSRPEQSPIASYTSVIYNRKLTSQGENALRFEQYVTHSTNHI